MGKHILLLNGPNLNLLGLREPHIYGHTTLATIIASLQTLTTSLDYDLSTFQSSSEGAILDHLHTHFTDRPFDFVIVNPGALTHTSVALRDSLTGINVPFIELHLSNVHAREEFRHRSFLSDKAVGVIAGLGAYGYEVAVRFAARHLEEKAADKAKL